MQSVLKLPESIKRSPVGFSLCLAFLFLVVLAFHGRPVPFGNEFIYLLRLYPYVPAGDWSFAQAANEHWLFNFLFSIPARFIPLEIMGWAGRVLVWIFCLAGLIKLGRNWKIPFWAIAFSISMWLAIGQAVVNAEWIFGSFEAKTVAYVCLLFALARFSKQELLSASVLLGLSFSFHPAVGLWAIPAVGVALLVVRIAIRDLIKVVALTFVFSLPGIVPLMTEQVAAETGSIADWQFIVTKHMPFHVDPFYFSVTGMIVLGLMLVFIVFALRKSESFALRFLLNFEVAIAAFFLLGVIMRVFELYPLLRFMPMRLFPILTPIFFLFTAFYFISRLDQIWKKIIVAVFVIAVFGLLHPIDGGIGLLRETKADWIAKPTDLQRSLTWISQNTPTDAVILTAPIGREYWYYSKRAQIVSYQYPRYDRLSEWRKRIADITGNVQITDRASSRQEIETAFDALSVAQIEEIRQKYSATHFVSHTVYPFPVIFETESYKVYQLP